MSQNKGPSKIPMHKNLRSNEQAKLKMNGMNQKHAADMIKDFSNNLESRLIKNEKDHIQPSSLVEFNGIHKSQASAMNNVNVNDLKHRNIFHANPSNMGKLLVNSPQEIDNVGGIPHNSNNVFSNKNKDHLSSQFQQISKDQLSREDLLRENVKLKQLLKEKEIAHYQTRAQRDFYKGKYEQLNEKFHKYQQRMQQPTDISNQQRIKNFEEEKKEFIFKHTNGGAVQGGQDEAFSLQLAMQLQQEEQQRAERHKRRQDEFFRVMMLDSQQNNEEQLMIEKAIEESKKGTVNPDVMSYEELLELSEKLGTVTKGFTNEEIELIPVVKVYSLDDENGSQRNCTICYENFKVGDYAKKLNCHHEFHTNCIDQWLQNQKRCAVCNQEVDLDSLIDRKQK